MADNTDRKYEYIPDVRLIMKRGGYDTDLLKILNEPVNVPFVPEIFVYIRGDINGHAPYGTLIAGNGRK